MATSPAVSMLRRGRSMAMSLPGRTSDWLHRAGSLLKAELDANCPLRQLFGEMVFAIVANAIMIMRDAYKVSQVLCITAHTTKPSSDKIRRFAAQTTRVSMQRSRLLVRWSEHVC